MRSTETTPPIKLSRDRVLSMPVALLLSVLAAVALGYAKWASTAEQVDRHSGEISNLQAEARATREILIRIDENVKDLRRAERRAQP